MNDPNLNLHPDIIAKAYDGDPSAQLEVGKAYYQNTRIDGNCYHAFKWIESSARKGDKEALFRLADMYALGHGVDQNILRAHESYTDSALQDYPKALIRIHNLYQEDKKIHCRGELDSGEEGMNELEFKKKNKARELYEYRLNLMKSKNLLGNTIEFFLKMFKSLNESIFKDKDIRRKLGFLYQYGYGIRKIPKQAIQWYTEAAGLGHISAQYNLGLLYEENTEIKFNYRSAFKWYTLAANGGHSMAQNHLAYFYEKGIVVEPDIFEALRWYTQAAANNNKGAMLNIARINRKGLVGDQNIPQSIKWYQKAAQQGSSTAKNCLYLLNQRNNMTEIISDTKENLIENESSVQNRLCSRLRSDALNKSDSPDFHKLEKLVSHALVGDGNAMLEVGFKYLNGLVFTKDKEIGLRWIWKAAKAGLIKAQLTVANMYKEGKTDILKQDFSDGNVIILNDSEEGKNEVLNQDYYEASIWYSLAAKRKDSIARFKRGMMYYKGHGLRKDSLEASRWFTWSAEQNNSDAQYMLGLLLFERSEQTRNINDQQLERSEQIKNKNDALSWFIEALKWFIKSAEQENPHALYQLTKILVNPEYSEDKNLNLIPGVTLREKSKVISQTDERFLKHKQNRAIKFCKYAAAKKNDLDSQLLLSEIYENGDMFNEKNPTEALKYYLSAAKNGSLEAKYKAGWMYLNGTGIDRNDIKAFTLIKKAADNNHPKAKSLFIVPIEKPDPSIDYSKVLDMFQIVTEKKIASLEYNVGYLYEYGLGEPNSSNPIEIDISMALYWYKRAESKNHPNGLYRLGVMNQEGKGTIENYNYACRCYERGSKLNDPESLNALASRYFFGDGVKENLLKAFQLYFDAANLGNLNARCMLAPLYGIKDENQSILLNKKAREMWEQAADSGNIIMQYRLGKYYETKGDIVSSLGFYKLAAQGGITNAYYKMGVIYEKEGETQGYLKSLKLYQKAMDKNHDKAIYRMAEIYLHGFSAQQNYEKSFQLYKQAAELGNSSARELLDLTRKYKVIEELGAYFAMFEYVANQGNTDIQYALGYLYEKILESSNYKRATEWYSMAELNSHREATYRLGRLYKYGIGVDQDWSRAIEYFEKAMKLNSSGAYFEMADMYHKGTGVEPDISKAKTFYLKAAELGDSDADFTLGILHEEGKLVAKDLLQALKWYTKAYSQMNINAIDRLIVLSEEPYNWYFSAFYRIARSCNEQTVRGNSTFYSGIFYQLGIMYFNKSETRDDNEKKVHRNPIGYFTGIEATSDEENAYICFNTAYKIHEDNKIISLIIQNIQGIMTSERTDDHLYLKIFKHLDGKLLFDIGNAYHTGIIQHNNGENYLLTPNQEIAFKLFNESSKKSGHAEKMLGDMYYYGEGTGVNREQGFKHHVKYACTQNKEENVQTANDYYEDTIHMAENESIIFIYLVKAEIQQYPGALNHFKSLYSSDKNSQDFMERTIKLHKAFAKRQTSNENINAGFLYSRGTDELEKNDLIANIYFKMIEKRKDPIAKRYLGDECCREDSDKYDLKKAEEFYIVSAHQLEGQQCFDIGLEYYKGAAPTKKNYFAAFIYFSKADQKATYAQRNLINKSDYGNIQRYLGELYYYGDGIKQEYQKAISFYELSASWLSEIENYNFGQAYTYGSDDIKKNISAAIVYLTRAMKQGNSDAGRMLGDIHFYGDNTQRDIERNLKVIMEFYRWSAKLFPKEKNYSTAQEYLNKSSGRKDSIQIAAIFLTKAAKQGYHKAGRELGDMYYSGSSGKKNQKKAAKYYKLSAKSFTRDHNYQIGQDYLNGSNGVQKSITVAIIYFTEAAERGHPNVGRYMGDIYYYGNGIKRDREKAIEFYQLSAEGQQKNKNYDIAQEYLNGSNGVKENTSIANIYLTKAAEQEHPEAGRYLGDIYYFGNGVERDHEKAVKFYQASANGLQSSKNNNIGKTYLHRSKVDKRNASIAMIYLKKAADQGHPDAKRYIADMYCYGDGDGAKDQETSIKLHQSSANELSSDESCRVGLEYLDGIDFIINGIDFIIKNTNIAYIYLYRAAEQGHFHAKRYVADMYYYGDGVNKNQKEAMQLYQSSANGLSPDENYRIGQIYRKGSKKVKKNVATAIVYLAKSIEQDYPLAGRCLGDMYYDGVDIEKNPEKAIQFYQASANSYPEIQNFYIGKEYFHGLEKVKKNTLAARIYFTKPAEQKNHEAERYLGDIYFYGEDVKENRDKGMEYYQLSADGLSPDENYSIGLEYLHKPDGIEKNIRVAYIYLSKAAKQENPYAQRYVADMYYHGKGVKRDQEKAMELYQSSANGLLEDMNFSIGLEYLYKSDCTNKNDFAARIYLTNAAEQGQHEAKRYLGDLYYYGRAIEKDNKRAIMLYESSANSLSNIQNYNIGLEYFKGSKCTKRNITIACIYLTKSAEQKNHEAERYLGDIYYYGDGAERDYDKGMEYYQLSADGLSPDKNYSIGLEYLHKPDEIEKSTPVAYVYLSKAAKQENPYAQRYVADMYYHGNGVDKDREEAMKLYQLSANGLSGNESFKIGRVYFRKSINGIKQYFIAYIYFNKAAEEKQHEAERYLGDMYYYGNGVEEDQEKAIELYQLSANGFRSNENFNLGSLYFYGRDGVTENTRIAIIYLRKAANQGHSLAKKCLGDAYYYGIVVKKNQEKAMQLYQSSANGLSPDKNYSIGLEYLHKPDEIEKSTSIAYVYLFKADEQKHPNAGRYVADMYYHGKGVERDQEKAMKSHESIAENLSYKLNFNVFREYLHGLGGFEKNFSIAFIYFTKTVKQGNHDAKRYLGDMYYIGEDVEKSRKKAKQYYRSSANGSSPKENYGTGLKYLNGNQGVPKNTSTAYIYFTKAAEQGDHKAERYLGDMYYYGECVRNDLKKAKSFYQSSANGLSPEENCIIGKEYIDGTKGTKMDPVIASIYLSKAAEQGNLDAKLYIKKYKL